MKDKPTYGELQQRVEALRKETHYLRSLLESTQGDIMVINRDYIITDVNNNFLVAVGRKGEDVIGEYCYKISHGYNEPCNKNGVRCPHQQVFKTGEPEFFFHLHKHDEGWPVRVNIRASPLKDEGGRVTHVMESIRDVTASFTGE